MDPSQQRDPRSFQDYVNDRVSGSNQPPLDSYQALPDATPTSYSYRTGNTSLSPQMKYKQMRLRSRIGSGTMQSQSQVMNEEEQVSSYGVNSQAIIDDNMNQDEQANNSKSQLKNDEGTEIESSSPQKSGNAFRQLTNLINNGTENDLTNQQDETTEIPNQQIFKKFFLKRLETQALASINKSARFIIHAIILLNSISLAAFDYSDRDSLTMKNIIITYLGYIFTIIFAIECVLKIVAYGFFVHKKSYLRDWWNAIDLTVVVTGILEIVVPGSINLRALRVFRVARPLKSINSIRSMRMLVGALLHALPEFFNVAFFLIFVFMLMAILGVHQYNGVFYNACRYSDRPGDDLSWDIPIESTRVCTISGYGNYKCPGNYTCGNPVDFYMDPSDEQIVNNQLVNYGITNFDNILRSLLSVFQMISTDSWSGFMFNLMDADIPFLAILYCSFIIVVGAFFLMNLILAVIIEAFIKIQRKELQSKALEFEEEEKEENLEKKQEIAKDGITPDDANNQSEKSNVKLVNLFGVGNVSKIHDENTLKVTESQQVKIDSHRQLSRSNSEESINRDLDNKDGKFTHNISLDTPKILGLNLTQHEDTPDYQRTNCPDAISQSFKLLNTSEFQQQPFSETATPSTITNLTEQFNSRFKQHTSVLGASRIKVLQNQKDNPQPAKQIKLVGIQLVNNHKLNQILPMESKLKKALGGLILNKQKEEKQHDQFFNKIMKDTRSQFMKQQQQQSRSGLRQLAELKLGIKMKEMQQNQYSDPRLEKIKMRTDQNKIYAFFYKVVMSFYFSTFITTIIIANSVILALDSYPEKKTYLRVREIMNLTFSIIFTTEIILKLIGLGIKGYFYDPFNIFDLIAVLASLVDWFIINFGIQNAGIITALRTIRLLRLFKLAKSWKRLELLIHTVAKTVKDISTFSLLLFLFMFIYSLIGLELFAYKGKFDSDGNVNDLTGDYPSSNFNEFYNAFTTIFIVLTNDGWSAIYYNYYRGVNSVTSTFYFISLIILGQKVLLNLFLAILLENFDEDALQEKIKEELEKEKMEDEEISQGRFEKIAERAKQYFTKLFKKKTTNSTATSAISPSEESQKDKPIPQQQDVDDSITLKSHSPSLRRQSFKQSSSNIYIDEVQALEGSSYFIFSKDNCLRKIIQKVVLSKVFDGMILLTIFMSSVVLSLQNPLNDPNGRLEYILYWIDVVTTIIFTIEAILKNIAYGFAFNGKQSYLRNPWNLIDFIILAISLASLSPLNKKLSMLKILRSARIVKFIGRNEGLQVGTLALFKAIPNILNVVIIMAIFFIIFGIIAIGYFKGKFYYCLNENIDLESLAIKGKWDCINFGGDWINNDYNFDNIGEAMKTLFVMSTASGWSDIMYLSISATEIDQVQEKMSQPYWIIFFIVFIVVGAFFLLNLFVGVIISTFNSEKDKIGGNHLLTDQQKEWLDTRLLILKSKPKQKLRPPKSKFRLFFYKISEKPAFDHFIYSCILLNTLILAIKYYNSPRTLEYVVEIMNYVFTLIFTLEAIIKILGQGKVYFHDYWNLFDLFVVISSLASIYLSIQDKLSVGGATTIIRAFRITRIIRLIKRAAQLKIVFNAFIVAFPGLINIGMMLVLLIYFYSIIGVYLFGQIMRNGAFNDNLNYETFSTAFVTLFIVSTGDNWVAIMESSLKQKSLNFPCIQNPTYQDYVDNGNMTIGCGVNVEGFVFYYSFILLVTFIFLNLFIAIILQAFTDTQTKESRLFNQDSLERFRDVWSDYDPEATTFIPKSSLVHFLRQMKDPMGFSKMEANNESLSQKFIEQLDLKLYNDRYQFADVLDALSLRVRVLDQIKQRKDQMEASKKESQKSAALGGSFGALFSKHLIQNSGNTAGGEDSSERLDTEELKKEIMAELNSEVENLKQMSSTQKGITIKALKQVEQTEEKLAETIRIKEVQQMAAEGSLDEENREGNSIFNAMKKKFEKTFSQDSIDSLGPLNQTNRFWSEFQAKEQNLTKIDEVKESEEAPKETLFNQNPIESTLSQKPKPRKLDPLQNGGSILPKHNLLQYSHTQHEFGGNDSSTLSLFATQQPQNETYEQSATLYQQNRSLSQNLRLRKKLMSKSSQIIQEDQQNQNPYKDNEEYYPHYLNKKSVREANDHTFRNQSGERNEILDETQLPINNNYFSEDKQEAYQYYNDNHQL